MIRLTLILIVSVSLTFAIGCPSAQPLGMPPSGPGDGDQTACPTAQESFGAMNPATFAVVVTYRRGFGADGLVDFTLGTAFGVDATNLATNAHVIFGILENPFPVERVVAVQAGTGAVFELISAIPHPEYTTNPIGSPDVGFLVTSQEIPTFLSLATPTELAMMAVGDDLFLAGFPGDVNELFAITPGSTVPQATSLSGSITAVRSFDPTMFVTPETTDFIQHQIPTTPGTSGSPLVNCGKVVAVHNAGTVKLVTVLDEDGNISVDRQTSAANNFGIHAKHLLGLKEQMETGAAPVFTLPPPAPDYSGAYLCEAYRLGSGALTHVFNLSVSSAGPIGGTSFWSNVTLSITGFVDQFGDIAMTDSGPSQGFTEIAYLGFVSLGAETPLLGVYLEGNDRLGIWGCTRAE